MVAQQAGTSPQATIVLSGIVPPLADSFYTRTESGPELATTLRPGEIAVLTHADETSTAPASQGGTGKTQLAVEFTHAMWNNRTVEVLIWVAATNREAIITSLAQAASTVDADNPSEGAEEWTPYSACRC